MPFLKDDKNFKSRSTQESPSYVGSLTPVRDFHGFTNTAAAAAAFGAGGKAIKGAASGNKSSMGMSAAIIGLSLGEAINRSGLNPLLDKEDGTLIDMFNTSAGAKPLFFQFFPETISDDRQVDFNEQTLPFFSNPIPTFVSGSPRTIGFTLQFAQEMWIPAGSGNKNAMKWTKHNFNVGLAVQAVRSFSYSLRGLIPQPLLLTLPGTQIGIDGDSIYCLLKGYSTQYEAFFPDGQPRLASMNLTFQEFTIGWSGDITGGSFNKVYQEYTGYAESAISNVNGLQISKDLPTPGKTKQLNSAPPAVPAVTALVKG